MREIDASYSFTIVPIVANNTTEGTGTAVDLQGVERATLVVQFGDSGDTLSGSVYWTPTLQESDTTTSGDFTNVAAADMASNGLSVVDAPSEDQVIQSVAYLGSKRYIRALLTATGTHTNGTPVSAVVVKQGRRHVGGAAV